MAVRERKSADARKLQIVETTITLAADIGPDRLTTQMLAESIGISQAAIFRHFPTKSDIWNGVAQHIGVMLKKNSALNHASTALPQDQLRALVSSQLAFIQKTPAIPAILFSRELHSKNEPMRLFFCTLMEGRKAMFAALIQQEIEQGRFAPSLNAEDGAWLILSLIQGLAMRWSLNARNFDLEAEGKRLLELQIAGFKAGNTN